MAASMPLKEYVDELTKCSICLEGLVEPKSLPCLHTFCLKCIKGHCKDRSPGNRVDCPVCRSSFEIPLSGVEQLTSNFFINGLVAASKAANGKQDRVLCDWCSEFGENNEYSVPSATVYCIGCGQKLCDQCSRPHQKMPGGTHKVVPFGSNVKEDLLKLQASLCDVHPGNKLEIYCNKCHINVCVTCNAMKHREHDCEDITDVYKEFSATLTRDVEQVTSKESTFLQEVSRLESALKQYNDEIQGIEKEVLHKANDLKKRIDEAVSQLLMKLAETKTAASKVTSTRKSELEFAVAASQSFTRYSREILSRGKPSDITHWYNDLHRRAEDLVKRDFKAGSCTFPKVAVSSDDLFDKFDGIIQDCSKVSKQRCDLQRNQVAQFATINSQLRLIHSMNEDKPIFGLTTLNNELFVHYDDDTDITVYDTETYSVQRSLQVPRLGNVTDMTSCKRHQCIYIADHVNKVVHRVDNKNTITQWPVNDVPHGLSVNSVCNVLVTCDNVGKVKEFTTNGKLIHEIVLESSIVTPLHTVELTTGQLVVCHGYVKDAVHRVCIVDLSGRVLQSYGGSKGSGSGQLNTPVRLAVNGVIFVADLVNRRVLMLSPTLSLIREVVSGLRYPLRIGFDDETGRLYVADNKLENDKYVSGQIKVYGV